MWIRERRAIIARMSLCIIAGILIGGVALPYLWWGMLERLPRGDVEQRAIYRIGGSTWFECQRQNLWWTEYSLSSADSSAVSVEILRYYPLREGVPRPPSWAPNFVPRRYHEPVQYVTVGWPLRSFGRWERYMRDSVGTFRVQSSGLFVIPFATLINSGVIAIVLVSIAESLVLAHRPVR